VNKLTGGHKRTAFVLASEIQALAADFGIEKLGFLTLTFADLVTDIREAQRRFNSLNSNVLKRRYRRAIGVWERQKSGRIHFHLVVVLSDDIRTGFDFAGIAKRDYHSASSFLRSEWAFWRNTAPSYGFGRTELLPVKSTAEGIARYVGKYVSKHIGEREESDKGARVVRFIGYKPGERKFCSRFAWNTDNSWLWRQKVKAFSARHGLWSYRHLTQIFGKRWAWFLADSIMATELSAKVAYPSEEIGLRELNSRTSRSLAAIKFNLVSSAQVAGRCAIAHLSETQGVKIRPSGRGAGAFSGGSGHKSLPLPADYDFKPCGCPLCVAVASEPF
jgi:hypothetical protein